MSDAQTEQDVIVVQVRLRPEHARRMRAFAAREGATVEALAALWLEEKLAEVALAAGESEPHPREG